jgi:hypothetical protein
MEVYIVPMNDSMYVGFHTDELLPTCHSCWNFNLGEFNFQASLHAGRVGGSDGYTGQPTALARTIYFTGMGAADIHLKIGQQRNKSPRCV